MRKFQVLHKEHILASLKNRSITICSKISASVYENLEYRDENVTNKPNPETTFTLFTYDQKLKPNINFNELSIRDQMIKRAIVNYIQRAKKLASKTYRVY